MYSGGFRDVELPVEFDSSPVIESDDEGKLIDPGGVGADQSPWTESLCGILCEESRRPLDDDDGDDDDDFDDPTDDDFDDDFDTDLDDDDDDDDDL